MPYTKIHEGHEKFRQEVCIKFHFLPARSGNVEDISGIWSRLFNITSLQKGKQLLGPRRHDPLAAVWKSTRPSEDASSQTVTGHAGGNIPQSVSRLCHTCHMCSV